VFDRIGDACDRGIDHGVPARPGAHDTHARHANAHLADPDRPQQRDRHGVEAPTRAQQRRARGTIGARG
jgi:hypothetical protein